MLTASHIQKSFDGQGVLRDVSLSVQTGEVVAIIGRSGSGKSTLLRCVNNLEQVDSGDIFIDDEPLVTTRDGKAVYAPPEKLRKLCLKMGFVFQSYNLFPHWTVMDNLCIPQTAVLRRKRPEAEQKARQLLERVGLGDRGDAYPCQLSGGQQQRVAIARAMALDPEILCFDEPTSALDPELTREVLTVIRSLAQEKRTMLIVTHEMKFAREVADRIVFMHEGVIAAQGTPEEVMSGQNEALTAFMGDLDQ
ncbi:MAG: amino acid ABC transporter ATP-binding protein [Eubacteriales bacterium]|nr:amino acid ABC transporter ATP-binding protein [Eubacteriales bacterium]